jgi:3-oxoacyl-[acyl-carrier protein] reductase
MLTGKSALITGGGTGIGRAIALRLAQAGAAVSLNYSRSEADAQATADEIQAAGGKARICQADVANDAQVRSMVAEAADAYGRLDILVNNAGVTNFVPQEDLEGLEEAYWDRALGVNVKGMFFCCRAAAPHLKKQGGSIVNVTSVAGLTGLGSSIAYAASKAAAISLTKSLARVLAPEVRVNSLAPGIVMTRWVEGHEDHVEKLAAGTPMGRAATPEDVAEVAFANITQAAFVTGQNLVIDGGMFI